MVKFIPPLSSLDLQSKTSQRTIVAAVSLASLIGAIDTSIVNIAGPAIIKSLDVSVGMGSLVIIAYMLTIAGLILIMGKLGDRYGFRNFFIGGLVLFGIASFLCGIAPEIHFLIGARILQGVGAAMFSAIGPAIITSYLPGSIRGRSLGYLISLSAVGFALGPGIGGFITDYAGWRWIFFLNLPIVLVAIVLGWYCIPRTVKKDFQERTNFSGPLAFIACLLLLLTGLSLLQVPGTPDSVLLLLFAAGIAVGGIFIFLERTHPDPLISRELLHNRNFLYGILASLIITALFSGVTYLMPLYLVNSRHLDHATAGLIMTMPALLSILVAPVAGSLADRHGSIAISAIATGLAAAGFLVFFTFNPMTLLVVIIAGMVVTRVSTAAFFGPNARLIMGHCSPEVVGSGSGVMMTARHVGMVLGIALFQNIFALRMYAAGIPRDGTPLVPRLSPELSVLGYQAVYLAAFIMCLIVVFICLRTRDVPIET